jgi:DNA-directed RNA polymerase subunit RPC12/RpoP
MKKFECSKCNKTYQEHKNRNIGCPYCNDRYNWVYDVEEQE